MGNHKSAHLRDNPIPNINLRGYETIEIFSKLLYFDYIRCMRKSQPIKVVELFAGVGGFRLGLEGLPQEKNNKYEVLWSNQWEPSTKKQHASLVYENIWGAEHHSNLNIHEVPTVDIPDHDLLVGGFPCQDYSVATTLKNSKGLKGKKGVLWWQIERILQEKINKPKYLFLENVDRLLKSPSAQRGRDFAVMLKCLDQLGYAVEWRVINAAEYGLPQRRRRVYILGYHKTSAIYQKMQAEFQASPTLFADNYLLKNGVIAQAFPANYDKKSMLSEFELENDLTDISNNFNVNGKKSLFENAGILFQNQVFTQKLTPIYDGVKAKLRDFLQTEPIPEEFYINDEDLKKWAYLKGAKKEVRTTAQGFQYNYSEGGMGFPDSLDAPARTIITGEGGKSPSRFKHGILTAKGMRRLTPLELERLNMFPDNHTKLEGVSDTKRAFFMGNALVVGVIERIGKVLFERS
ncbi:MAG: DNA (cytosine-5)-methyltransferase 1 [Paraglaciecola sp.]